uniref:Uncharacterized protein n=1 Tax=Trichogramma kaykai TaxID=54128 RepID=A0ABD2WTF6_9HYME
MCKYRPAGWCAVRTATAKCERASTLRAPETIGKSEIATLMTSVPYNVYDYIQLHTHLTCIIQIRTDPG